MRFLKYQALGNDYIVLDPDDFPEFEAGPPVEFVRRVCDRHFGVGSDGILWGPTPPSDATFRLRIFNPDGSEAEKSGNGLRIFARAIWDRKLAPSVDFSISTAGGIVQARILDGGRSVVVDMGRVSFRRDEIPVAGVGIPEEVVSQNLKVDGHTFRYTAATIGNPHCVISVDRALPELARRFGPGVECLPLFPRRTNVQFMEIVDRRTIRIEIWERGAGYTLASGSSASASAAVARKLGLVEASVTVQMPGGDLGIEIGSDYAIRMTGPVRRVSEGKIDPELFVV